MKICLFHPYEYNGKIGGTDIYVAQLASYLLYNGHIVFIICPSKKKSVNLVDNILVYGIEMYGNYNYWVLEGLIVKKGFKDFKQIILNENPDIVHFHGFGKPFNSYLNFLYSINITTFLTIHLSSFNCAVTKLIEYGQKSCDGIVEVSKCSSCTLSYHSGYIKRNKRSIFNRINFNIAKLITQQSVKRNLSLFKNVNSKFTSIIVLNEWYKNVLLNNNFDNNKIAVLTTAYNSLAVKKHFIPNKLKMLFLGRLNESKGFFLLLESLINYDRNYSIELNLFGEISNEDAVRFNLLLPRLNPAIKVILNPHTSFHYIQEIMNDSDLVCVPSIDAEMCPLVVVEAQSKGLIVLGANHSGIADLIIDYETGILFNRNDSTNLLYKIYEILDNVSILKKINENLINKKSSDFCTQQLFLYERSLNQFTFIK
jgi:glycosyltransferase involved in cell wall biosynthesis